MFSFLLDVFIPRSRIGGSLSNSVFYQWNNCQTLFQNICSILHSHQQCTKVLISAHPYCLFVYSHSRGWSDILLWFWFAFPWWLMMFSIFSCTCPLVYLLWRDDSSILCPFLNWVICFLVELQAVFMYSGYMPFIRYMFCKYFLPFCGLSSHFLDGVLGNTKVWNFENFQSSLSVFYCHECLCYM